MMTKPPQPPTQSPKRDYAAFDKFAKLGDELNDLFWTLTRPRPCNARDAHKLTADYVRNAEQSIKILRTTYATALKKFWHEWQFYDRVELYETSDKTQIKHRVVEDQVGVLLAGFANANPGAPIVVATMLVDEVYCAAPRPCELESACRQIRRTMKFVPTVCEMLEALREQKEKWDERCEVFEDIHTADDIDDTLAEWCENLERSISAKTKSAGGQP
jgi:hypothetical protein